MNSEEFEKRKRDAIHTLIFYFVYGYIVATVLAIFILAIKSLDLCCYISLLFAGGAGFTSLIYIDLLYKSKRLTKEEYLERLKKEGVCE